MKWVPFHAVLGKSGESHSLFYLTFTLILYAKFLQMRNPRHREYNILNKNSKSYLSPFFIHATPSMPQWNVEMHTARKVESLDVN